MSALLLIAGIAAASVLLLVERAACLVLGPLCRGCRHRFGSAVPRARARRKR